MPQANAWPFPRNANLLIGPPHLSRRARFSTALNSSRDLYFIPPGAASFRRDVPNAAVQFLDPGHFALETHIDEITSAMRQFLSASTG